MPFSSTQVKGSVLVQASVLKDMCTAPMGPLTVRQDLGGAAQVALQDSRSSAQVSPHGVA
eukprot:2961484-Pyramimonas_sp.AAC.1